MNKIFYLILSVALLISCKANSENGQTKKGNKTTNIRYFINSVVNEDACYLYVEDNNDTIYGYTHVNGIKIYPKVKGSQELIELIKEIVKYHLKVENFQSHEVSDRTKKVVFFVESAEVRFLIGKTNTLKFEYYGPTSDPLFKRYRLLIKKLKMNYKEFRNWK